MEFDELWRRIQANAGQPFRQVRGATFTYDIHGETLQPDRTNRKLPRSQFLKAWQRAPLAGPGELQDLQGPSYLFAILNDPRISGSA